MMKKNQSKHRRTKSSHKGALLASKEMSLCASTSGQATTPMNADVQVHEIDQQMHDVIRPNSAHVIGFQKGVNAVTRNGLAKNMLRTENTIKSKATKDAQVRQPK